MSKNNPNNTRHATPIACFTPVTFLPTSLVLLGLLLGAVLAPSARAQSVAVRAQPIRVTIPDIGTNFFVYPILTNTYNITNFVDLADGAASITLSLSGVPAGIGALLDTTLFTNDGGGNLAITATNVANGEHTLMIDAAGDAVAHFPIIVHGGRMWQGDTNASLNWSSGASWVGGVSPGASDEVLFTLLGAMTNAIVNTNFFPNSVVDANTTISALRFSHQNGFAQSILINSNRTLSITGTNGLRILKDATGLGGTPVVNFAGQDGKLVISNQNANIATLIDNQQAHLLDFSRLGTLVADVNRIGLGDYLLYPNYSGLISNGFSGNAAFLRPRRFVTTARLARTNIIVAHSVDPNNYLDPSRRIYSLTIANNEFEGTGTQAGLAFGISNALFMDSICFGQSGGRLNGNQNQSVVFNAALTFTTNIVGVVTNVTTNNFSLLLRNVNGGRMSVFSIADDAGPGAGGTGSRSIVDFTRGSVNAMVDRLYLARERTNSVNATPQGTLTLAGGVFDVNTAILGFQGQGNNQDTNATPNPNFTQGTVNVNSNAIFRVNDDLILGYTTATAGHTTLAENGFGLLTAGNGGTVQANKISVGGVTKVSVNNRVTMSGGNVIVSNTIAGPNKMLNTFSMASASTLTLHLTETNTGAYVYATNLSVSAGQNNVLKIATIGNIVVPPAGTNIPIFIYGSGSANFSQVVVPAGLLGNLIPNGPNQYDLTLLANTPKDIVWRGTLNGNWDTTTTNWLDLATLQLTNYVNGDNVRFDDAAGVQTTISMVTPILLPTSIAMSNTANAYTISGLGGGTLQGSATLTKDGTGSLTISGSATISLVVNAGSLLGNGTVGAVVIGTNAAMNFSGTINNGVTCFGVAVNSGIITGTTAIRSPSGTFTNAATGNLNGNVTMQTGTLLHNAGNMSGIGNMNVPTNAVLLNFGNIGADQTPGTLTINGGEFRDMGVGFITLDSLTVGNRGVFFPGSNGIGITTVLSTHLGTFPGRVQLLGGSTNVFKINPSAPANTLLLSGTQDFGPSQSQISFNGCTLQIVNVGGPFTAGQYFKLFGSSPGNGNILDSGSSTNSFPVIDPATPGTGLAWDLRQLRPGGLVGVIGINTNNTQLLFNNTFGVIINTNGAGSTNPSIVTHLQWGTNEIGWKLQTQENPLSVGLSSNWNTLAVSAFTNDMVITNALTTNAVFFRLVFP